MKLCVGRDHGAWRTIFYIMILHSYEDNLRGTFSRCHHLLTVGWWPGHSPLWLLAFRIWSPGKPFWLHHYAILTISHNVLFFLATVYIRSHKTDMFYLSNKWDEVTFQSSLDSDKKLQHGMMPDFYSRWRWREFAWSRLIKQYSGVTLKVND